MIAQKGKTAYDEVEYTYAIKDCLKLLRWILRIKNLSDK